MHSFTIRALKCTRVRAARATELSFNFRPIMLLIIVPLSSIVSETLEHLNYIALSMKSKVWRSELVTGHGLAQYLFKILRSN